MGNAIGPLKRAFQGEHWSSSVRNRELARSIARALLHATGTSVAPGRDPLTVPKLLRLLKMLGEPVDARPLHEWDGEIREYVNRERAEGFFVPAEDADSHHKLGWRVRGVSAERASWSLAHEVMELFQYLLGMNHTESHFLLGNYVRLRTYSLASHIDRRAEDFTNLLTSEMFMDGVLFEHFAPKMNLFQIASEFAVSREAAARNLAAFSPIPLVVLIESRGRSAIWPSWDLLTRSADVHLVKIASCLMDINHQPLSSSLLTVRALRAEYLVAIYVYGRKDRTVVFLAEREKAAHLGVFNAFPAYSHAYERTAHDVSGRGS